MGEKERLLPEFFVQTPPEPRMEQLHLPPGSLTPTSEFP